MWRWHCRHVCRISSKTLDMTFYGLVEMIKGDFADMVADRPVKCAQVGSGHPHSHEQNFYKTLYKLSVLTLLGCLKLRAYLQFQPFKCFY